jgi:gluconate kinase
MNQSPDLELAPKILFLFGLSGAGKSYVGNLIGELAGWHVYHADDDLTAEMILALKEQRPFTEQMRDDYFPVVAQNILALKKKYERLVVTQGVYKQRHRDYLMKKFPEMEMLCVDASDQFILQRLGRRKKGITHASAEVLRSDFELPDKDTKVIMNQGGRSEIVSQLNLYFSKSRPN